MAKSPLARVFAPVHQRSIVADAEPFVKVPAITQWERPNFTKFLDKFMDDNFIRFSGYKIVDWVASKGIWLFREGNVEVDTKAKAEKIAAAFRTEFPDWEITTRIEDHTYRPPYQVSWEFSQKGGE